MRESTSLLIMDSMNNSSTSAHHHQHQQQNQQQQSQQQQFCLRWHNHQASLLSTLPLLLDQSHLTDVTLSAEGKTLQAHRVVLSACSSFFSELFRTLDTNFHPVIVIPGASFTTIVALLTFMYSGEVNVFEEQIPTLLTLAETLGIKGLADLQNNNILKSPRTETNTPMESELPPPLSSSSSPPPPPSTSSSKISSPLEHLFMKSFQFYPNILTQPLNFSQSALNKTTEFLYKYHQQQFNLAQNSKENIDASIDDHHQHHHHHPLKRSNSGERKNKDAVKKIDKIAENLRAVTSSKPCLDALASKLPINMAHSTNSLTTKSPQFPNLPHHPFISTEEAAKMPGSLPIEQQQQQSQQPPSSRGYPLPENLSTNESTPSPSSVLDKSLQSKPPNNSKLYATCFICYKQLSNQYNLRVHLETHQNVRYACNVCSHVSRSKDALRKHVSYRHPGAPSPCETEARRKRSKGPSTFSLIKNESNDCKGTSTPPNLTNQPSFMFLQSQYGNGGDGGGGNSGSTTNAVRNPQTPPILSTSMSMLPAGGQTAAITTTATTVNNETAANIKKESTNSD